MKNISIHALREEGDAEFEDETGAFQNISIHALREEGDVIVFYFCVLPFQFLSTPSARRATAKTEKASPLLIKV